MRLSSHEVWLKELLNNENRTIRIHAAAILQLLKHPHPPHPPQFSTVPPKNLPPRR